MCPEEYVEEEAKQKISMKWLARKALFVICFLMLFVLDYGLDGRCSIPGRKFFSTPQRLDVLDWLWGPPSLLSNEYWKLLSPWSKAAGA
jgi:hypothetical protein